MNRKQVLPEVQLSANLSALRAVDFCAAQTYHGTGFLPLKALPRVVLELANCGPDDGFEWHIQSQITPVTSGKLEQTLLLKLKGQVHLPCQRCLQAFLFPLYEQRLFLFVSDEAAADAYPIDDDQLEALVASHHFDLLSLIEDEILLSLPLVPKHSEGHCAPSHLLGGADKPENPFKVLKNIKK
ncbi:COG1399 Predicted metal-binding, possibly nucleic acid-binding protein [Burkholderiaceae bacterium]|jgi:uncharacterized protein